MRRMLLWLALALGALTAVAADGAPTTTAHDFTFTSIDGEPLPVRGFAGKAVLVVNTASFCGFTYQYAALQELWESYRDRGLVVLGVPSNDFGNQARQRDRDQGVLRGQLRHRLPADRKAARARCEGSSVLQIRSRRAWEGAAPRWNFHKYLVTPEGKLAGAWPSRVEPGGPEITQAIDAALAD